MILQPFKFGPRNIVYCAFVLKGSCYQVYIAICVSLYYLLVFKVLCNCFRNPNRFTVSIDFLFQLMSADAFGAFEEVELSNRSALREVGRRCVSF